MQKRRHVMVQESKLRLYLEVSIKVKYPRNLAWNAVQMHDFEFEFTNLLII